MPAATYRASITADRGIGLGVGGGRTGIETWWRQPGVTADGGFDAPHLENPCARTMLIAPTIDVGGDSALAVGADAVQSPTRPAFGGSAGRSPSQQQTGPKTNDRKRDLQCRQQVAAESDAITPPALRKVEGRRP